VFRALSMVALVAVLYAGVLAPEGRAAAALLAVDDASPALTRTDDGGWKGPVGLTNLSDGAVTLSAAAVDDASCSIELSRAAIGAAQSSEPTLTVPAACQPDGGSIDVVITATGATTAEVPLVAELAKADQEPAWGELVVFPFALLVFIPLALIAFRGRKPTTPLSYLESSYSFKESWISNITVLAGLLTGVFGSADVVKAFLGEDADRSIALATVGSAVALILVGTGPIVLTAAKQEQHDAGTGEFKQVFTVGGLVLATTVAVAGAFGQLWIGWKSGQALELGGAEDVIVAGFLVAVGLLIWYTIATLRATSKAGTTPPPPSKPSELSELLKLFKKVLDGKDDVTPETTSAVLEDVMKSYPISGTGYGDEPLVSPRRRTAMP